MLFELLFLFIKNRNIYTKVDLFMETIKLQIFK